LCETKDARLLEGARIDGFGKRANGVDQTPSGTRRSAGTSDDKAKAEQMTT
jgi:hypothetical protein